MDDSFSMRSARSLTVTGVIALVLVGETTALHVLLVGHHPFVAWGLTVASISTLLWLVADARALGRSRLRLEADGVSGHIARRAALSVPTARISAAFRPGWQDLSKLSSAYFNATSPATPNVLVVFRAPIEIRVFGVRRKIQKLGLHLDEPARFVEALSARLQA